MRDESDGLGFEIALLFLGLIGYFFWFYIDWPIWDDHAIFHTAAFRWLSGEAPYRDFVLFHWPGTFILHAVAYVISGIEPLGLRIVDIFLLFILSCTSLCILRDWGLRFSLRLLVISFYIATYFAPLYEQTAQRDGLQLPFVIGGLLPFLMIRRRLTHSTYLICGLIMGFAIWFKPACILIMMTIVLYRSFLAPKDFRTNLRSLSAFTVGILVMSLIFIAWLLIYGSWDGFWDYAIEFTSQAYVSSRDSFATLFWKFKIFLFGRYPLSAPATLVLISLLAFIPRIRIALKESCTWQPHVISLALTLAALAQYYWQGKGWCYQLFPFQWALCLLSGALLSRSWFNDHAARQSIQRFAIIGSVLVMSFVGLSLSSFEIPKELFGTQIGRYLRTRLESNEAILGFGFPTMDVQMASETHPPISLIETSLVYFVAPEGSDFRKKAAHQISSAFRDPRLRFVVSARPRTRDSLTLPDELQTMLQSDSLQPNNESLKDTFNSNFEFSEEIPTAEYSQASYVIYSRRRK